MTGSRSSHHQELNPIDVDIHLSDASISQDQNIAREYVTASRGQISEDRLSDPASPRPRTPEGRNIIDIVDEILAVDPAKCLQWAPDGRPEYVNGKVHLTDAQWDRVLAARPASARHRPAARAVWGIPVVLHPNRTPTQAYR